MKRAHMLVLNYNGRALLEECMPSLVAAAKRAKHPTRLTVIDNCSKDNSVAYVRERFPGVGLYEALENRVLCSFNECVRGLDEDVVILLNNDIKVQENFVDPLVEVFENRADAFLASSRSFLFDGGFEGGKSLFFMKHGLFGTTCRFPGHEKFQESFGLTHQAGYGAFDRQRFLDLGGFDDLYLPGRLEDSDLCFRAWRRGYRGYYQPRSVVYHKGGASFLARFGVSKTLSINFRNTFLFMWKNLSDPKLLLSHAFLLFPRIIYDLLRGRPELALGFFQALPRMRRALAKRAGARIGAVRSDREIFHDPNFFAVDFVRKEKDPLNPSLSGGMP